MQQDPKKAQTLAEQGVAAAQKGDKAASDALTDTAKRIDKHAVEAVAQETEEHRGLR